MGNGPGGLKEYIHAYRSEELLQGGSSGSGVIMDFSRGTVIRLITLMVVITGMSLMMQISSLMEWFSQIIPQLLV